MVYVCVYSKGITPIYTCFSLILCSIIINIVSPAFIIYRIKLGISGTSTKKAYTHAIVQTNIYVQWNTDLPLNVIIFGLLNFVE